MNDLNSVAKSLNLPDDDLFRYIMYRVRMHCVGTVSCVQRFTDDVNGQCLNERVSDVYAKTT